MDNLRAEFIRLLTQDSETSDRRRKDYNQAIFIDPSEKFGGGEQAWTKVNLEMVLAKFDQAVKNTQSDL